ncbi:MAG: class I SAM-dependent methyltransferase [Myxococcaceae bacterium]
MAVPSSFATLPLKERLFVRARLFSAPLEAIAQRAPRGKIADVGCGHGLLTALLAEGHPEREVVGVDPDPAKIAHAQKGPGRLPNVKLQVGTIDSLSPSFDAVMVADVLYLLPSERWLGFLQSAHRLLKPGGRLFLKEAEANQSWKYWKCVAQERVMVNLLRKTHSSGGLGFKPRAETEALLRSAGFASVEAIDASSGYATPHVLFVATG